MSLPKTLQTTLPLLPYVEGIWAWDSRPTSTRVNNLPDVNAGLLLSLSSSRCELQICGAANRSLLVDLQPNVEHFAILFRPGMGPRISHYQPAEILNEQISYPNFFGLDLDELGENLNTRSSQAERARHLMDEFAKRSRSLSLRPSVRCQEAIHRMANGFPSISRIAREMGISIRSLERAFKEEVGMTPKQFTGILRFRTGMKAIRDRKKGPLTALAHTLGFSDQAHFIHDFRQYAGVSPGDLESIPHFVAFLQSLPDQDD